MLIDLVIPLLVHIVAAHDLSHINYKQNAASNEAPSTDFGSLFVILVLCLLFCFAVRHMNDFYAGDTITLVEEGTWKGRYRHRPQYLYLKKIQDDFNDMMDQLREADKTMWSQDDISNSITTSENGAD